MNMVENIVEWKTGVEYFIGEDLSAVVPPYPDWKDNYGIMLFPLIHDGKVPKTVWIHASDFTEAANVTRDWIRAHCGQEPFEVLSCRMPGTEHLPAINWPFGRR